MREWLENLRIRFDVWRFERRAIEARIVRSCGHVEEGKVLPESIAGREVTACPECTFREALADYKRGL